MRLALVFNPFKYKVQEENLNEFKKKLLGFIDMMLFQEKISQEDQDFAGYHEGEKK